MKEENIVGKKILLLEQKYTQLAERTSQLYERIEKNKGAKSCGKTGIQLLSLNSLLKEYRLLSEEERKMTMIYDSECADLTRLTNGTEKEMKRLTDVIRIMRQTETANRQKTEAENLSLYSVLEKLPEEGSMT